ncbi:hypothetical protein WA577_004989, partial [Blastocystis sp. JDR]
MNDGRYGMPLPDESSDDDSDSDGNSDGDEQVFDDSTKERELVMKNLPKLVLIHSEGKDSQTFLNPETITLENMPLLTDVTLPDKAFRWRKKVTLKNIGSLQSYFARFVCSSVKSLASLSPSIVESIIVTNSCNSGDMQLDLSSFVRLKQFVIGDHCFISLSELRMSGLLALESFICGNASLIDCSQVVFESGSFLSRVMNRPASFDVHS